MRRGALCCVLLTLVACGYPGDTRPPTLALPVPVRDLAAVQRGSKIIVQFTVPVLSTDGLTLKNPPDLELQVADSKFHVKSAPSPLAHDEVTATPFAGQTVKVVVKARNNEGRDAGYSNVVDLKVVPALPTPMEVAAAAIPTGVQVTWKSPDRKFRVLRKSEGEKAFTLAGEADARVYMDTAAAFGKSYRYIVQAVDGVAESDLSVEVEITPKDTFSPAVPSGVTAVVGTQSVELLWDRNLESDLAGYRIYRDGKLLGESKDAPSFSDRAVERGKNYNYAVAAYDRLNNESGKSETVEARIP